MTVEVAAPGAGVLREILKQEQEEIAPGELLGRIDGGAAPGQHARGAAAADAPRAVAAPAAAVRAPAGGGR